VTPVSAEAFISLQKLIVKQDAHALDETSKQSLERHIQKLTNAAQTAFAKGALQKAQIQFLLKINNEAKVRRSTKSLVLGKAKVMSYEDLVTKRAEREAKDQAKAKGKGKCGRKRKSSAEADAAEADTLEAELPEAGKGKGGQKRKSPPEAGLPEPAKVARMTEAQLEEDKITPVQPRAPVARMW
jgi:hypothetical protein